MITLAICDVDIRVRKSIRVVCERYFESRGLEYQIFQYAAGEELLLDDSPDILIMDVMLKRMSGIFLKEILEKLCADTRILYVSENRNHMSEAFGRNVYGYLIKPLKETLFIQKMDEIVEDILRQSQCVFLQKDYQFYKIWFKDILYIEVSGRGTRVYINSKDEQMKIFATDISISKWEEGISNENFCRVSKRIIVNLRYVIDIKDEIQLSNQVNIPIGLVYKEMLKKKYEECKLRRKNIHRNAPGTDK